ncbi:MAG: twin-arginine translocation signal domain-containing protein [Chloroflexota bacterium]|nr:twin-arginine translocation signal domain-containing protein [Chloroflexota bacterium]
MIQTTSPARTTLSRRRFLTLVSALAASAALAACGGSKAEATATTAPDGVPTTPTDALTDTAATATLPPPATASLLPSTAVPSAIPAPTATSDTRGMMFRPLGVINVRQYGAAGDGATDDTAAIQAAIDAVPPAGGTVLFPPGTYIVAPQRTVGIAIKSNLRLAGAGAASVLKIKDHLGDWQRLLSPRTIGGRVENFIVEDLAFDGNILNNPEALIDNTVDATYQTFVHITAGANLTVQRCRFAPYSGVWAISFNGSGIQNCAVTDCFFQFVMRDGSPDYDNSAVYVEGVNYTFSGNRFEGVPMPNRGARACMEAHGGPAEVFNNTSTGFQTILNIVGAYNAGGSPGDINCHDNTCTDALQGIMLWPTLPNNLKNVTVANNTIVVAQSKYGPVDTAGIYVLFSPEAKGRAENIAITGNTIRFEDEGAGRSGFFYYNSSGIGLHNLGGVSGVVIDGNTIELAPSAGVAIGLPEPGKRVFDSVRVTNNQIINPGQNLGFPADFRAGVLVSSTASGIEISGNTIVDTFATPHCPAAVVFDPARGNTYRGIKVTNNTITAATNLLLILPPGAAR